MVTGYGKTTGEPLVDHPDGRMVSFTGGSSGWSCSDVRGSETGQADGHGTGGKSSHIVLEDADLDLTVNGVVPGIFLATGYYIGPTVFSGIGNEGRLADRIQAGMVYINNYFNAATQWEGSSNPAMAGKMDSKGCAVSCKPSRFDWQPIRNRMILLRVIKVFSLRGRFVIYM